MDSLQIDQFVCTKCGFCAGVCPDGLIDYQPRTVPKEGALLETMCIRCGACVAACRSGALNHKDIAKENCPKIDSSLQVSPSQCEQLLRSRRSIRNYKNQPIRRSVIKQLINIARYAPTSHNNQGVEWLVIDDIYKMKGIEKAAVDWFKLVIQQNPGMAGRLNLPLLLEKQEKNYNSILRGAPVLIVTHAKSENPLAAIDCTIALTYFELAAKSFGLGTCWAGLALEMANTFPPVKQILNIPEGQKAYGIMMLGYPTYSYSRLPARKEAMVTWSD